MNSSLRFINPGEGDQIERINQVQPEKIDVEGKGVEDSLIQEWDTSRQRLSMQGEIGKNFKITPQNPLVVEFLEGEYETIIGSGKKIRRSKVNNPMGLFRPNCVRNLTDLKQKNNIQPWQVDVNKLNYDYLTIVDSFEFLSIEVLKSINIVDKKQRIEYVEKALKDIFNPGYLNKRIESNVKKYPSEKVESWLLYSVLNILDSQDVRIQPIGRVRALELLDLYSAAEMAKSIGENEGFHQHHNPRLPYSITTKEEKLSDNHRLTWMQRIRQEKLIIVDNRYTVDWRQTAALLTGKNAEEGIQVILLLLHYSSTTEGAIGLLKSIPSLDPHTLHRMFGPKATFIIEHRLKEGNSLEDLINQGVGNSASPVLSAVLGLEGMTSHQKEQLLNRSLVQIEHLEEELFNREVAQAKMAWRIFELEQELARKHLELLYWQTGAANTKTEQNTLDQIDPKGYYRILELHPQLFIGMSTEQIDLMINRHYRFAARLYHPDAGGEEEKMKLLNEARDNLLDIDKRNKYSRSVIFTT